MYLRIVQPPKKQYINFVQILEHTVPTVEATHKLHCLLNVCLLVDVQFECLLGYFQKDGVFAAASPVNYFCFVTDNSPFEQLIATHNVQDS